ncbi:MAG: hypothetical protein NTV51_30050 [Verrucomicrobia bacterium]|nr:hypothetical protein [Verrucomicrobiota bacterium]
MPILAVASLLGGCALAQSEPPPPRPFGEIAREERGVVASVQDTMIDLRTGQVRTLRSRSPTVPVGPVAVSVPVTFGGEKRRDIPGEEITVRLASGKSLMIVQEQGQPPFAVGEQVKVQHEKANEVTRESRKRVVRPEEYESPPRAR